MKLFAFGRRGPKITHFVSFKLVGFTVEMSLRYVSAW